MLLYEEHTRIICRVHNRTLYSNSAVDFFGKILLFHFFLRWDLIVVSTSIGSTTLLKGFPAFWRFSRNGFNEFLYYSYIFNFYFNFFHQLNSNKCKSDEENVFLPFLKSAISLLYSILKTFSPTTPATCASIF